MGRSDTTAEDVQSRFLHLAAQMDELVQLSNVERERAEESAMAIQLEFDRALQRLQDSFQDIAEAAEGDGLVEGGHTSKLDRRALTSQWRCLGTNQCGPT